MELSIDQMMYIVHAEAVSEFWQCVGMFGVFMAGIFIAAWIVTKALPILWDRFQMRSWFKNALLLVFIAGMVGVGSTKNAGIVSRVNYLYTDVEQRYLFDNGSYVTNDYIHIDFTRLVAPNSADFIIDYYPISITNQDDIADNCQNLVTTTFGEFPTPCDIAFEGATNFHFICYTTWTPGPSVQTNGVFHLMWQQPIEKSINDEYLPFVPYRTGIYLDDEKISPPMIEVDLDDGADLLERLYEETEK